MKKIRVLSLLLILTAFIIVGCGELNDNLKLSSIDVNVSDFYFNFFDDYNEMYVAGEENIQTQEGVNSFKGILSPIDNIMNDALAITLTMDFCENAKDDDVQKIYEYYLKNSLSKVMAVVTRDNSKSVNYRIKMFKITCGSKENLAEFDYRELQKYFGESIYYDLDNDVTIDKLFDNTLKIGYSNVTEKYTIGYKQNRDCSCEYYLSKSRGYMTLSLSTYSAANSLVKTSISLYSYKNNTFGGRVLSSYSIVSGNKEVIWEFLDNCFNFKSKVGYVKDSELYEDMVFINAEDVAVSNKGDASGYLITCSTDNFSVSKRKVTILPSYGNI